MKNFIWILVMVAVCMISCSRSAQHRQILSEAERIVYSYPDSALLILEDIDPKDLKEDSLKALYAIVVASAHKSGDNSMVADSLTKFAFEYYNDNDFKRYLQAGDLYALHRFWLGDGVGALKLLDSLTDLPEAANTLRIELLRSRINIGAQQSDYKNNISFIRQCLQLDSSNSVQSEFKRKLSLNYLLLNQCDSALILIDELIEDARKHERVEQEIKFQYDKIAILEEAGRYVESNELADHWFEHAPKTSAMHCMRSIWKAVNFLNMHDFKAAADEISIYDTYTKELQREEYEYIESFAWQVRNVMTYQSDGKISMTALSELFNNQRTHWFREKNTSYEQKQNALKSEKRSLIFKSQSERKTHIIVIVLLVAFIIIWGCIWLLQKRKRTTVEAEERAETLQRMVNELQKTSATSDNHDALRRAMLQQLNIIKMVAATPTEQNREMLRKISFVDNKSDGPFINWANVYEIVDNLHSGFYSKLHKRFGDTISEKELQTIVLLAAGFSAKEISVITCQSAASVYVRKSSVKKKLGVSEKEDVIDFLRSQLAH